ncbi:O-methyltransferase [Bacteriovorax sp. BSW11_IV]|uniref:O-methyltransferase n=1 Tax=Bacteriovorax sp. BSW11_IV TaxID=1353529 RepID=UPI00038A34FA|nr:class I SAM-dependent methyltransferase [Bacteriovorax sp. BSW11_IV]EQC49974.1 O-methyltransferase [Bacteriovorax sp. BSW11_IV]
MNIIDPKIEQYAIEKSTTPTLCGEVEEHTRATQRLHHMMVGKLEASVLGMLIKSMKAKRVLEFGTFTGYSALAMAEFLPEDGEIITVDMNKETTELARSFWDKTPVAGKIKALNGSGAEVLESLANEKFDLIFVDADKRGYMNYFIKGLEMLNDGGAVVIDNVLWSGKVVEGFIADQEEDRQTAHIKEFNDYVASRADLFKTYLPIRDGIYVVLKNA